MSIRIYSAGLPASDFDWGCEHSLRWMPGRKFLAAAADPDSFIIYQCGTHRSFVVLDLRKFPEHMRLGQIMPVKLCRRCFDHIRNVSGKIIVPAYF